MNGITLILVAIIFYIIAYRFYGKFISNKLKINAEKETPSHTLYDGIDYVPAKSPVLLGHHFASIAGAGPIVGPVIAAGFGWIPVYLWVLFGAVLIGGVHDFTTIIASIRHQSKSIGFIIEKYIGISGKKLFLLFAWATLILVIAVFTIIVADTFTSIPAAGTSSILFMLLAVMFGLSIYKFKFPLWLSSIFGVVLLFLCIPLGEMFPLHLTKLTWQIILFGYIFLASVTPVWILLQPRDYLNSYFLYSLMLLGVVGVFFSSPALNIPAVASFSLDKVGYLFPALFVTVACGAVSGFHSIVASGTTAKQLNKETDGKLIGYGGMLIEGVLAVLALVAVSSLGGGQFAEIMMKQGPVAAFSISVANFIESIPFLSIKASSATNFVALAVAAFALTSLDTATRLGRYAFQEFFEISGTKEQSVLVKNRFAATSITVAFGAALTFSGQSMAIWPVFGSANQLLAALALLAITVWVASLKENFMFVLIPMIFMFGVTLTALVMLFYTNVTNGNYILSFISILLFLLAVLLGIKAYTVLVQKKPEKAKEGLIIQ
ncbi:MAG TPA: carbon starvation protein A [Ignavibacteriaceae bacterium]|nr:carbon starvation protein A [Ignavibacteriaceae bacterium]